MPQAAVGMPGDCMSVLAAYKHVLICILPFDSCCIICSFGWQAPTASAEKAPEADKPSGALDPKEWRAFKLKSIDTTGPPNTSTYRCQCSGLTLRLGWLQLHVMTAHVSQTLLNVLHILCNLT